MELLLGESEGIKAGNQRPLSSATAAADSTRTAWMAEPLPGIAVCADLGAHKRDEGNTGKQQDGRHLPKAAQPQHRGGWQGHTH